MARPKRTRGIKKPRWGLPPLEGEPQRKALFKVADYDKLMEQALACLQIQSDADRDRAIGEIEFAIAVYREISDLDENAPRSADLKVTLGDIKRLAGRLALALSVADYHSLRLLDAHGALRLLNEQGGLPLESIDQSLYRPEFDATMVPNNAVGKWCCSYAVEELEEQLDEAKLQIRNLLLMQPSFGRAAEIAREEARKFIGEDK